MKLTPDQLRQNAAAMIAFADGKPIEFQMEDVAEAKGSLAPWHPTTSIRRIDCVPHRPKPEPKVRPWVVSDVPAPICWLRNIKKPGDHYLVTLVCNDMIYYGAGAHFNSIAFADKRFADLEYSTDRKQWAKCEVTEEA